MTAAATEPLEPMDPLAGVTVAALVLLWLHSPPGGPVVDLLYLGAVVGVVGFAVLNGRRP